MSDISYKFPGKELLKKNNINNEINYNIEKERIENFFRNYGIEIECKEIYNSINAITYVIDLKYKTRVKTIMGYKEDLMLNFESIDVEFQVAINGTSYLGIQLINNTDDILMLGNLIDSNEFIETNKKIPIILGKDFNDKVVIEDLSNLPHLLIAGTTGTGKSNLLSTFVIDILYKLKPEEVKLILVDTRKTNFSKVKGIPHLLIPVITDAIGTIGVIVYLIEEMNRRYVVFATKNVDNIDDYNEIATQKIPKIVLMIEDFCDLMMESEDEIEDYIVKLIQMSRAAGIYVIISTQRPSTNVLTGIIKANIPARITFRVPSQIDSKTIIDASGAERLFEYGDILFTKLGNYKFRRIQTPYITDEEIDKVVKEIKSDNYSLEFLERLNQNNKNNEIYDEFEDEDDNTDPLLSEAIEYVMQAEQASTSFIQRRLKVGYARAGKIMDEMEERGIISGYQGSKPREILMTMDEWKDLEDKKYK